MFDPVCPHLARQFSSAALKPDYLINASCGCTVFLGTSVYLFTHTAQVQSARYCDRLSVRVSAPPLSSDRGASFPRSDRSQPLAPDTGAEKFESFARINSIPETNGSFDSCKSCKRLGTSRLHELHESKFPFVSGIEFIRSKLSDFSAHVSGVTATAAAVALKAGSLWTALRNDDSVRCLTWQLVRN